MKKHPLKHQQVRDHIARREAFRLANNMCISWHYAHCDVAGVSDINTFDFSRFVDEDAGTPSFVEYHHNQLQACGVRMGRSGYKVLDLHKTPMYHVEIGNKRYSGGVDGGVVPYAVRAASAAKLLRIGFEHKQSTADKATFRMNHPDVLQVRSSGG